MSNISQLLDKILELEKTIDELKNIVKHDANMLKSDQFYQTRLDGCNDDDYQVIVFFKVLDNVAHILNSDTNIDTQIQNILEFVLSLSETEFKEYKKTKFKNVSNPYPN